MSVGVLDKAVGVLQALRKLGPLGLFELEQATNLPHTTTHRLALALEEHGLVRRDPAGRFSLGFELIAMGRAAADSFPLAEFGRGLLTELRDATGESVQLYVREGDERRCVVSLESAHGLRWIVPEGSRLPLGIGSGGRVLSGGQARPDDAGRATEAHLVQTVEEREPGVASVSAPVLSSDGTVIAAVSVSGPVARVGHEPTQRFGRQLLECANSLAAVLVDAGL